MAGSQFCESYLRQDGKIGKTKTAGVHNARLRAGKKELGYAARRPRLIGIIGARRGSCRVQEPRKPYGRRDNDACGSEFKKFF